LNLIRIMPAKGRDRSARSPSPASAYEAAMPSRPASDTPIPATIAVVIRATQVLLVRRANPPDAGRWGFPGGKIEPGETLPQAALRELAEETGVSAEALRAFTAVDAFDHDASGGLRRHFVLIAVLCRWTGGEPIAGDDALEARWVDLDGLAGADLELSRDVAAVAAQAAALTREART
jgi:mutator protein MutT